MKPLKHYAQLLYGTRWQRGLAEDMGVHRTSLAKGCFKEDHARKTLVKKMKEHVQRLIHAISELE